MSGGYSVCHSINQTALPRALWEYGSAETSGRSAPHLQPDTRRGWFLCGGWSLEGEGELPNSAGWRNVSLHSGGQSLYCQASKDSEKPQAVCLVRLEAGLPELLLLDSPFCSLSLVRFLKMIATRAGKMVRGSGKTPHSPNHLLSLHCITHQPQLQSGHGGRGSLLCPLSLWPWPKNS